MKVKQIFPIAAMAIVAIGSLASCGTGAGGNGSNGGNGGGGSVAYEKINIWAAADEAPVVAKVLGDYNKKNPNAKIDFTITKKEENKTVGDMTNPEGANAADLFLTVDDQILNAVKRRFALKLDASRIDTLKAENEVEAVESSMVDGELYGFPICFDNGYVLYYNKDVYSDKDVQKLETILDVTAKANKQFYFNIANGYYVNSFFMSETVCGKDSMQIESVKSGATVKYKYATNWDSKGYKMAEAVYKTLDPYYLDQADVDAGKKDKDVIIGTKDDNDVDSLFTPTGKMSAAISGIWKEKTIFENFKGVENKIGCVKLPTFNYGGKDNQMASFTGAKVYCINAFSKKGKKKSALKAAELLTSKEAQLVRFKLRGINPCNLEAREDATYADHKSIVYQALEQQRPFSVVQAKSVSDTRYWDATAPIGKAMLDGNTVNKAGNKVSWQTFLKEQMNILRVAK